MTDCVLHAGIEKTGSKSLQQFLKVNASALARRRVWVPACLVPVGGEDHFNQLLVSTASRLSLAEPDDLQRGLGLSTMDMVRKHRTSVAASLQAEASGLKYIPDLMIVSNEHVHSRLENDQDLQDLRSLLAPFCARFRVIVYLRRQDELALSLAVTAVRNGQPSFQRVPDFSGGFDPVLGTYFKYFDYRFLLERLERVFGAAALDVRLYKGDVIAEFVARLGINLAGLSAVERQNRGMSEAAVQLLSLLNRQLGFSGPIRSEVMAFLAREHAGHADPAPAEQVAVFMAAFRESNESVRQRWFPQLKSLFEGE